MAGDRGFDQTARGHGGFDERYAAGFEPAAVSLCV